MRRRYPRLWCWLRDVAIGVAVVCVIPLALLVWNATRTDYPREFLVRSQPRIEAANQERLPFDTTVTPARAAEMLLRVLPAERPATDTAVWHATIPGIDSSLFPTVVLFQHHVDHAALIRVAAGPLTPPQRAWLQQMGTLPIWPDVDLAARAPSLDLLGAARPEAPPFPQSMDELQRFNRETARVLKDAMVARAAWHVSRGEVASADTVLRTLVSLGRRLFETPLTFGDYFVAAGYEAAGLRLLAALRNDSTPPPAPATDDSAQTRKPPLERAAILALLRDPQIPLAQRMLLAALEPSLSCSSVRATLTGASRTERERLHAAYRQLARTPQELRLLQGSIDHALRVEMAAAASGFEHPVLRLAYGTAHVAAILVDNPRVATCAGDALTVLKRRWQ